LRRARTIAPTWSDWVMIWRMGEVCAERIDAQYLSHE
jgi:hypothetical protein